MISQHDIRLAQPRDAARIAVMSRDFIESGLGWRWTEERIAKCMRDATINVVVAGEGAQLSGFGIMEYRDEEAHLLLLAVQMAARRHGVGSALMSWLEATVLTAGIGMVYLESRLNNREARAFYKKLGYRELAVKPRYYRGREDAIRLAKDLWAPR
jgi:ribosomal-protein-alanine acetyltransferase